MRWLALPLLALTACGQAADARVAIDVASLWQQSPQTVDSIHVRVFNGTDMTHDEVLTDVTGELLLDVVAGTLRFEVEALTPTSAPSLFGEKIQTIAPGEATVDVPVVVFPAGGIAGTVTVSDGTAIPVGTKVVCTADQPRSDPEAVNQRDFVLNADGTFAGTLLDGATTLTVSFDNGTPYTGTAAVTVVREQTVGDLMLTVGP